MKRLSILLAGSALAISAHAVNWVEVSESRSGSMFSIDLDSIESSDISIIDEKDVENITVSMLRTYPKNDASNKWQENRIHHSEQQLLISCKDASYYRRAYVNYDSDNKVTKSWQSKKPILTTKDFKITTPKTIGRTLIEQVCKSAKQDEESDNWTN
ncbi:MULTISPECIES: hypothetical protein [unclassified Psychrobacter]|uniref:hypothetical protein n=1 Tax=unclassified Psychrobacter TaxID=196806 RepID=UPI0025B3E245|nr:MULTISPECIES: hypothetical protein [unclassified Psychrobacter]MDN3453194.1 hypothetical protein [Psychrobacter sp. APC 3350]MDN3503175.1 hypothetical protein [Psychrobacter sp. 5A.1]